MSEHKNIIQMWSALKTERDKHKPLFDTISKFTGINVDPDYAWGTVEGDKARQLDEFVDDPTSAINVNQFGDYLLGIMWGTGDKAVALKPSRYVLEYADPAELSDWYGFATDQTLYHMNHSAAGLNTALRPYAYDQAAFGTSGVGCFMNNAFVNRVDDNALIFRNYGVDNTVIDEGKNGMIEVVFTNYRWKCNRIVNEFCLVDGAVSEKAIAQLPKMVRDAYAKQDLNLEFTVVFGTFPRDDFSPKLKGKRGTRYRGVWFIEGDTEHKIFLEESYSEKPIAMCRQIKIRGQVYGRSSGTMLISTIRSVNFIMATVIEIIEKMGNPSLGIFNNALFGDMVLDTSPNGLTTFNATATQAGGNPAFPLYDVGDPSAIVQFLLPYLNDKIATAFKVDSLLDFNQAAGMTATESLQRYAIRGKSLAGILQQQKIELLEPLVKRAVSLLFDIGELGIDARVAADMAQTLKRAGKSERIIPHAVQRVIDEGRPWYEVKFNNELEKMTRTESVQNLLQAMQAVGAIASMYPQIIEAVDWYTLLKDINDNLDANSKILYTADEFKAKLQAAAQQQQAMLLAQASQMGSEVERNTAQANKLNSEAANAK